MKSTFTKILKFILLLIGSIAMILFYVIGGLLAIIAYVLSILFAYSYFGIIGAIITISIVPFSQLALFIYLWWAEGFHQIYSYAFLSTIIFNSGCILIYALASLIHESIRERIARRKFYRAIAR